MNQNFNNTEIPSRTWPEATRSTTNSPAVHGNSLYPRATIDPVQEDPMTPVDPSTQRGEAGTSELGPSNSDHFPEEL
ncbi:hypothetical protein CVT24_013032, partial [Panaeolus cyanescens]